MAKTKIANTDSPSDEDLKDTVPSTDDMTSNGDGYNESVDEEAKEEGETPDKEKEEQTSGNEDYEDKFNEMLEDCSKEQLTKFIEIAQEKLKSMSSDK